MCGIIAILLANTTEHCRQELYDGLTLLQHRGQDATGMVTAETNPQGCIKFKIVKDLGMVKDVFQIKDMESLSGNVGIGHIRYPTFVGSSKTSKHEAQPMYNSYPCGLAMAHNGNLTNVKELTKHLATHLRHLNTDSDSEMLLGVLASELQAALTAAPPQDPPQKIDPEIVIRAVSETMKRCRGGYAVSCLIHDVGVVSFRDPWGIRPLVYGSRNSASMEGGVDYIAASESVAIEVLGFNVVGDVPPGGILLTLPMQEGCPREDKGLILRQGVPVVKFSPCLFEYVYFARQDSVINGVLVQETRVKMGMKMAELMKSKGLDKEIDIIVPVPETSCVSAKACADGVGKPYVEALVKNRYIGRTFIMPGQDAREKNVRLKLNPIKSYMAGRKVMLVDDSIVRGTTSKAIVKMCRDAGAAKVFIASVSPQIRYQNVYGIDLPTRQELVAHERTDEQIADFIGADGVIFLGIDQLRDSVKECRPDFFKDFDASVFNGEYVTGDIDDAYFKFKGS